MLGDTVSNIIALESGEMDQEDAVQFIQELVDDGTIWELQGSYQRMAFDMADAGLVTLPAGVQRPF